MTPPPPSPGTTLAERLADQIAEAIRSGAFAPGLRLDEHQFAARYGVSRSPVHDALRLLAGTGLTEARPYAGTRTRRLGEAEVAALFTAMGEVEASCARLSALAMTEARRAGLQAMHARRGALAETGDRSVSVEADPPPTGWSTPMRATPPWPTWPPRCGGG